MQVAVGYVLMVGNTRRVPRFGVSVSIVGPEIVIVVNVNYGHLLV